MKKIITLIVCLMLSLAVSVPSFAIELSKEAVEAKMVPASYAKVKNGNIVFGKQAIAYSPDLWNRILNAYGVTLAPSANIPSAYASAKDGDIVFKKSSIAYSPDVTHAILTAYGLTLSPDDARMLKDPANYVKVKNGQLVFGKSSTAYSPEEFDMLLGAYKLPVVKTEPQPEPTRPEPEPAEPAPITPEPKEEPEPVPVPTGCPDADNDGICDDQDNCPGTPRGAYVNEKGCWIIENVLFDFDKSVIKPKYYPDLDNVARVLNENPDLIVEIQGHTCWIGTKKYNQGLSERRAKAVVEYLRKKGIDPSRLSWKGYGELRPAFDNKTREGRIKNRRVEIEPKP